ncbi:MAG: hypothetical protein L0177_18110 [Chloroflexi bacterium]|nr:hypothetical protein [Chloroflexota bacterium]
MSKHVLFTLILNSDFAPQLEVGAVCVSSARTDRATPVLGKGAHDHYRRTRPPIFAKEAEKIFVRLFIGTYRPVEVILQGHRLKAVKQELEMHALCAELALDALAAAEVVAYLARRI